MSIRQICVTALAGVLLLSCGVGVAVAAEGEVLLADDFAADGPLDAQKWEVPGDKPPECRDGTLFSARSRIWHSKQTFSEPVSVEFSGVYLRDLPSSAANTLGLGRQGWAPELASWDFDGSRKPRRRLLALRRTGGVTYWQQGHETEIDLLKLPNINKPENAFNLRIDWWPGKVLRYYLNGKLVTQFTDGVPPGPLPVGVRDETSYFRIGTINVTRITTSLDQIMSEIAQVEAAKLKARKEAQQLEEEAAKARREAILTRLERAESPPEYALLLHLDGGDTAKDSSVFGFELEAKSVTYEKGRFGQAARFDGKESSLLLAGPMIERPGYQYLSFCFPRETVTCWVRPDRTGSLQTLLGAVKWFNPHDPNHRMEGWQVVLEADGKVTFDLAGQRVTSASAVPAGEWAHVAAVSDLVAGEIALYVNGKPEGKRAARPIRTGGKFFIGAGDAGFFSGLIDEVAVHLRALSAEEIATRAAAQAAFPDPKVASRFYALPANDHTFVFLCHGDLPGNWFLFRLPEYAYENPRGRVREARRVRWLWEDGGWTYTWLVPDDFKKKVLLDFRGRIIPSTHRVFYQMTAANRGTERWPSSLVRYQCMRCADTPAFHDEEGERTFIRQSGTFVNMIEAMGGKKKARWTKTSRYGGSRTRLLARQSKDGKRIVAVSTDNASATGGNFAPAAYCMHSNPKWGRLDPGETKTIHGCVYLLPGGFDELYKEYVKDFGKMSAEE